MSATDDPRPGELIARLGRLDSCAVSDALDKLGLKGTVTGIHRLSTDRRISGRIVTVKLADATVITGIPRNEDNFSLQLLTRDGTFHLLNKANIVDLTRLGSSAMPSDYGRRLSAREIDDLIGFLQQMSRSRGAKSPASNREDGDDE